MKSVSASAEGDSHTLNLTMITYFKDELIGLVLLYDDVDGFPQVQLGLVGSIRTRVEGVVDDH